MGRMPSTPTGHASSVDRAAENRDWVDFAKGVAIILVVLYHCGLFLSSLDLAEGTARIRALLAFYPMPVFFFVAGLTSQRMLTWSFKDLWRRRLLTLVYLYLLWSVIRVLFYLVVPHLRATESAPTDPLNVLLLPVWPTSSYWFVWALAIFTLLAWLLRGLPRWLQVTGAVLLAVAGTTPGLLDTNNVGWDRVAQDFVFFLVALFIPHQTYRFAARVRLWHAIVLTVAYVGLAAAFVLLHATRIPGLILLESAVAVLLGIAWSTLLVRLPWLGWVSSLGQRSFQIYLVHLFIVAVALWALTPLAGVHVLRFANLAPYLLAALVLVASVYLSKLLRPVHWLWVSPFRSRSKKSKPAKRVESRP
ncbi:MAG: putative rane protein YcfT [Microbacteriaceae bacterium]|nr:putative rane protein YcfT [Microbacteriaceae bacterium]